MARKATSMRGETVDFDLFAIKEQINGAPVTETIQNRERFIDLRRKRGTRRKLQDMLAEQEASKKSVTEAIKADATADPAGAAPKKRTIQKKKEV